MTEPLATGRFSTDRPIKAMTIQRARRIARALAKDGAPPSEVRQFLKACGFDLQPVFDVIRGGADG